MEIEWISLNFTPVLQIVTVAGWGRRGNKKLYQVIRCLGQCVAGVCVLVNMLNISWCGCERVGVVMLNVDYMQAHADVKLYWSKLNWCLPQCPTIMGNPVLLIIVCLSTFSSCTHIEKSVFKSAKCSI